MPLFRSRVPLAVAAVSAAVVLLFPSPASAHSLDSSTISVHTGEDSATATISIALESFDEALGTDYATATDVEQYADEVITYLDEHLSVTGTDGTAWTETYTDPVRESVEGIASFSVDVALDAPGADASSFTIAYDAIIEADPAHQAVVVLTDAVGEISTAGVLTASDSTLQIGDTAETGVADMIGYGFHHVLDGADHLLFLITLLLVAPLVVAGRRWQRRDGIVPASRKVVQIATAFTLGHSLTLIASALGWVTLASGPVEVLIAASVAVSALHALRPLTRHGQEVIAVAFGLVHGLAFAGILTGLGLDGAPSLLALLAFNLGVELAQLATVALIFPSLYLASRTRFYPALRVIGASGALTAATGWALERLGVLTNPLAGIEDTLISRPWWVAAGVAVVAAGCRLADHRLPLWRSAGDSDGRGWGDIREHVVGHPDQRERVSAVPRDRS